MQLHQVRYFLAVARAGSMTAAAKSLYLSQPSLSEQIRKLERELGCELFQRHGRGLVLTAAGEVFRTHAERAMHELEQAREGVHEVLGLRAGRIGVGVLPSVGAALLPRVLATFRQRYPGVDVDLVEESVSSLFEEMVSAGRLDVAIMRRPRRRSDLAERLLVREPLVLLAPGSHPLAGADVVDPAVLRDEPFVAFKPGYGLRDLMLNVTTRAGFEPRIVVETGQLDIARALVAAGVGVTILPRMAATPAPYVPLHDPVATRELIVVWRAASALSRAAVRFLELLDAELARSTAPPAGGVHRGATGTRDATGITDSSSDGPP